MLQHLDGCDDCRQIVAVLARGDATQATVADAHVPFTIPNTIAPGSRWGRYIVLEQIGRGGMGVVYAAYDTTLDRKVALKRIVSYDEALAKLQAAFDASATRLGPEHHQTRLAAATLCAFLLEHATAREAPSACDDSMGDMPPGPAVTALLAVRRDDLKAARPFLDGTGRNDDNLVELRVRVLLAKALAARGQRSTASAQAQAALQAYETLGAAWANEAQMARQVWHDAGDDSARARRTR